MKTFADQAVVGVTPVAVTEVNKDQIVDQLSSRDVPFALENTPSFYVTNQGGGNGDSRLSVRGFNQRNVSILINGVPTNDNENGWLYWSNWDGLGDATQSIQLQRGLSYSTLPTPSIGGTLNVITDPAAAERGVSFKIEAGDFGFQKQTATVNTGLLANRLAVTVSAVRKQGQGYVNGTWYSGQGYYLGASYKINAKNHIEIYGIAAPQLHGQNSYQQNIATLDQNYAKSLGYTDAQIAQFPYQGRKYNQRWNYVSPSYTGMQYYYGKQHGRHASNSLNEVVNYYNKPQFNANWFSTLNDNWKWNTVIYWSGGEGGGGGTTGTTVKMSGTGVANPAPVNWDATIAANQASTTGAKGILYNNTNYQDTYGAVSKLSFEQGGWRFSTGIDARYAKIDHWEEVRDLLGASYYVPSASAWYRYYSTGKSIATTQPQLGLGDRFYYDYTNKVKWLGTFAQAQYEHGPITAFGVYGFSVGSYKYINHMVLNDDGSDRTLEPDTFYGHQIKGGIQYKINKTFSVFTNAGYVTKIPLPSAAVTSMSASGILAKDIDNETFTTGEAGVRANLLDKKLTVSTSFYYTLWRNYTVTAGSDATKFSDGTTGQGTTSQSGIDSNYGGLEVELNYKPFRFIRFDASASFSNWYYSGDGKKEVYNYAKGQFDAGSTGVVSLKGVKVGDAPQQQINLGTTIYPVRGLSVTFNLRNAQRYYSKYSPETRTNDWGQSWQIPNYTVYDLHANYRIKATDKIEVKLFAHILNLFDKAYIQDATDNYFTVSTAANHSAQKSEVYFGSPLTANGGISISF